MFKHADELNFYIEENIQNVYGTFDPFKIADDCGIKIKYVPFMEDPQGMIANVDGQKYILISDTLVDSNVKYFICAHELYHHLSHNGLGYYYISSIGGKYTLEREANSFATSLVTYLYKDMFDPDPENVSYLDVINHFQIPRKVFLYEYG